MKRRIPFSYWIVLFVLFAGTNLFSENSALNPPATKYLNPPPEQMEFFHFGFNESMADSLWLRWVQDSDYCQTYLKPVEKVATTLGDDKMTKNPRHRNCDNSWGFKMLDSITRLAPRFMMPYEAGAITLSVVVEDYAGASVIFDRGVSVYPNDWVLNYRAAYHYLYDRQDLPRAAALMEKAASSGAPKWLKSLAARLYQKAGQLELGISALENYRKMVEEDPEAVKQVDSRLADLREQLSRAK